MLSRMTDVVAFLVHKHQDESTPEVNERKDEKIKTSYGVMDDTYLHEYCDSVCS
jgi:hypothetical protein